MSLRVVDGIVVGISDPQVTEVLIPQRIIKSIGPGAFAGCTQLRSIIFQEPSAIKHIESNAFANCEALCMIHLPPSLEWLGDNAFRGCVLLSTVHFSEPSHLLYVGQGVFNACRSLQEVTFPNSLKYMDKRTFYNCVHLRKVRVPRGVRVLIAQSENDFTRPSSCLVQYT